MIQKRSNKFAGFFALPSITAKHYLLSIEKSVLLDYVCSKLSLADRSSSVFCFTTLWPLAYFRPSPGLRLPLCGTRIRRRRRLQAASRFHFHSIYVRCGGAARQCCTPTMTTDRHSGRRTQRDQAVTRFVLLLIVCYLASVNKNHRQTFPYALTRPPVIGVPMVLRYLLRWSKH